MTIAQSGTYGVTVYNPYSTTNLPTFDLTFVAPSDSYAAKVMTDNPSAYWRLDETGNTNGATARDQAGGHDGTYIVGTAPGYYSTNGVLPATADTAVRFINANPADGSWRARVEVPYSPALNPSGAFSVECFNISYYDGDNSGGYLVSSQNRPTGVRQGWMLGASANSVNYDFFLCDGSTTFRQINSGAHCYPYQLVHQVGVYDGTNAYIYVNGVQSGPWTPAKFVPNPGAPLEIACRNGNYLGFDGVIDEVAVYGYALSANQVSNHWSSLFAKAAITLQPVGVTTNEGSTVTLTAAATGYVNTYQWFKDGVALEGTTLNNDSTPHYPQGVTSPTLVITQVSPTADAGSYWLQVYNTVPNGNAASAHVNVTITPDTTAPKVLGAAALGTPNASAPYGPYLVKVWFNKRIDAYAGTYTIDGVTVNSVTVPTEAAAAPVGGDWREAIINTAGLTPGQTYTVRVSGVKDQTVAQNPLVATNLTFRAPLLSQGLLVWDFYYLGGNLGGSVADLTGSQWYPNTPSTNLGASTFDSTPLTSGDANNVGFGAAGDHYGCSLSGWITPKVTGSNTFFLASDDASELWLSTDSTPQNAALIAYQTGCCNAFTEPGTVTYTSQPILMQAGTRYFIRALQVEGGGGDWVKVAWRLAGDTTPAGSLTSISGAYLSSYAPGPALFATPVYSGGQLTLNWTGTATLMQSANVAAPLSQWTPVPGNPVNSYTVTPAAGGAQMYYRLTQ
ncbi:MAG: PA14 domain-containing protein [Verrucomicrobia bacterium]|nr:PA14 domain-containing protein [Verrucomicrobiota bacterium]